MASFDVRVRRLLRVDPHPNADRLELAVVDGYRCVVPKDQFRAGDLIAYIPEAAVLPMDLVDRLGLTGKLAGPEANRVKAVRLRGALSQGVCMAADPQWSEGESVRERLGIVKFEPVIPDELKGAVYALEEHERLAFDLENIKAFPAVFADGEPVVMTEKIHGLFLAVGAVPQALARVEHCFGRSYVSSKGLLAQRMAFQNTADNDENPYVRAAVAARLHEAAVLLSDRWNDTVLLLGEVFGAGVQDLSYGEKPGQPPAFRLFSIVRLGDGLPVYLDDAGLDGIAGELGLQRAPVLYRGPFSQEQLAHWTSGKESVSGRGVHLREGVVVTPQTERQDAHLGRVVLKSVSEAYLLRSGGTEYA